MTLAWSEKTKAMKRILIIGTSCSGKSTLAADIACTLEKPHIEMDDLFWLPDWRERQPDDFRMQMQKALSSHHEWVMDGNYSVVRDMVWPQVTTIIWLNYSLPVVLRRALTRTIRRAIFKEKICGGNRESFKQSFFSKDSILLWVLKTYHDRRARYPELLTKRPNQATRVVTLTTPAQAREFVRHL